MARLCAPAAVVLGLTAVLLQTVSLALGGTAIVGGVEKSPAFRGYVMKCDVFDLPELPNVPEMVYGNTLTAVGSVLYSCGGGRNYKPDYQICHTIDLSSEDPQWTDNVTLPRPMSFQTAVVVNSHIWFTHNDVIYDFDPATEVFKEHITPFYVTNSHCAVSNSTHSFMLGVGTSYAEIWINSEAGSPASWEKVQQFNTTLRKMGCLWVDDEIFVTGGDDESHLIPPSQQTLIFNVNSFEISWTGNMVHGRELHRMYLLNGLPAVVGGHEYQNAASLATIETYNATTRAWSQDNHHVLTQPRESFGLAELTL